MLWANQWFVRQTDWKRPTVKFHNPNADWICIVRSQSNQKRETSVQKNNKNTEKRIERTWIMGREWPVLEGWDHSSRSCWGQKRRRSNGGQKKRVFRSKDDGLAAWKGLKKVKGHGHGQESKGLRFLPDILLSYIYIAVNIPSQHLSSQEKGQSRQPGCMGKVRMDGLDLPGLGGLDFHGQSRDR